MITQDTSKLIPTFNGEGVSHKEEIIHQEKSPQNTLNFKCRKFFSHIPRNITVSGSSMVSFRASNKFKYLFFSHNSSHFHECDHKLADSISLGYIWAKRVWSIPIFTDDDRGLKRLPRSIRGCLLSSEQLQPIGLLFPERPSECEEQDHSTTNFVKSVLQAGPSGIPDTEICSQPKSLDF